MSESASEPAPAPTLRQIPRRYLALGLIIVAIVLLGALVLVRDNVGSEHLVDGGDLQPGAVLARSPPWPPCPRRSTTPSGSARPPTRSRRRGRSGATSSPLWLATVDGGPPEPVVFFYGAEFAPYAAAERWPLVLALSRFGTFDQLGLMQSSATTAFANLSTFTFWNVSYSSRWLILESVERYSSLNPTGARYLGLADPRRPAVRGHRQLRDEPTTFALLDVANRYVLNGAAFTPGVLAGLSQDQIAGDLTTPASPLTQAVVTRGQRDHGHHLLGRRRPARRRVRAPRRAGGRRRAQDRPPALTRRSGRRDQLARRSSMSLRSTSFIPPQIPWGSRILMA